MTLMTYITNKMGSLSCDLEEAVPDFARREVL